MAGRRFYNESQGVFVYYDCNNVQLHEGDMVSINGREPEKLLLTVDGELGTDATNPSWIKNGRAFEGEFGVYPLDHEDLKTIVKV